MSSDAVISAHGLSKCYNVYARPQDRLKQMLWRSRRQFFEEFWALKEVSFDALPGDTIGILGRNGAGKSTLLQLIAGTLNPTSGSVVTRGRVAALLELGSGFNPEFTGRENVLLNAAILGLSNQEIESKYDDILAFADIGEFVEQPVKTYSTGMYMRLAFAVMIHVDPQVLIVDEALAVGDFMFQHKCYRRISELKEQGVTILLATHSIQAIREQCTRAMLLDHGRLLTISDDTEEVAYQFETLMRTGRIQSPRPDAQASGSEVEDDLRDFLSSAALCMSPNDALDEKRFGTFDAIIHEVVVAQELTAQDDAPFLEPGRSTYVKMTILAKRDFPAVVVGAGIRNVQNETIWGDNNLEANHPISLKAGINIVTFRFELSIRSGEYLLYVGLADIAGIKRVELDQRWPVKRLAVVGARSMAEGFIWAPVSVQHKHVAMINERLRT
jgi:lipopolysaccharide transport system ATP-binding protein